MNDREIILAILSDKPIAYHPDFAKAVKSVKAGVFLSQLFYWSDKGKDPIGIYKTQEEIYSETGLSRQEQETARTRLKSLGVLQERLKGMPAQLHYKIDFNKFISLLKSHYIECGKVANKNAGKSHTSMQKSSKHVRDFPAYYHTENTTKSTTENTRGEFSKSENSPSVQKKEERNVSIEPTVNTDNLEESSIDRNASGQVKKKQNREAYSQANELLRIWNTNTGQNIKPTKGEWGPVFGAIKREGFEVCKKAIYAASKLKEYRPKFITVFLSSSSVNDYASKYKGPQVKKVKDAKNGDIVIGPQGYPVRKVLDKEGGFYRFENVRVQ